MEHSRSVFSSLYRPYPVTGRIRNSNVGICPMLSSHEQDTDTPLPADQDPGDPLPQDVPFGRPYGISYGSLPVVVGLSGPVYHSLWLVLLLFGTASLFYLLRHKVVQNRAADPLSDPSALDDIFVLAIDQQAPVHIQAMEEDTFTLEGSCTNHTRSTLTVSHPYWGPVDSNRWQGKNVEGMFHIITGHKYHFYRFTSTVLDSDATAATLTLARPARLVPFQRRRQARFTPALSHVIAMGLWPLFGEVNTGELDITSLPFTSQEMGPPALLYYPGQRESVRLADISSQGIGLRIGRNNAEHIPRQGILLFCLHSPDHSPLILWLLCSQRHLTIMPRRQTLVAGFEFFGWSEAHEVDTAFSWQLPGSQGEIPPLHRWLSHYETRKRRAEARYINLNEGADFGRRIPQ